MGRRSDAVGQHGAVHGGLGLGDHLPQRGIEPPGRAGQAVTGRRGQVQPQPGAQPARRGQRGQRHGLGIGGPAGVQGELDPGDRRFSRGPQPVA